MRTPLITENIRGMEIVKGTTLTPEEYEALNLAELEEDETDDEIKEIEISLSLMEKQLNESSECFQTILNINKIYQGVGHLTSVEENTLDNMILRASSVLHLKYSKEEIDLLEDYTFSSEGFFVGWKPGKNKKNFQQGTLSKIIDKIYMAIVSVIDILYELLGRFYRWFKELFLLNEKRSEKITAGIRYLTIHASNDTYKLSLNRKEAAFFTIEDKFSIEDTLGLYTSLFGLYTHDKTLSENVRKVLAYKITDNKYMDIDISTVFPVTKKEHSVTKGRYDYYGPMLPKGYQIRATLPDPNEFKRMSIEEKVNVLNGSDFYVIKVGESKAKQDVLIEYSKESLELLNNTQLAFNRQCTGIITYMDTLISAASSLRRHKRNLSYYLSSQFDSEAMKYMTSNLAMISYIMRDVKEPFFTLNRMAQSTNKLLQVKLLKFLEKEINKERKK